MVHYYLILIWLIIKLKTKSIHFYVLITLAYHLSLIVFIQKQIDSSLNDYTTSAQSHIDFYKVKTNLIFDTYTTTTQLYDGFYTNIYIENMF